jgi:hypothetical protein
MLGLIAIPKLVKIVLITGTLALAFGTGWKINGWRLEARIADLQASYALAYAEAQKAARDKENALTNDLASIRRSKDAEIQNVRRSLDIALNSLRHRPERPADSMPTDSVAGGGCTGKGLARGDAEFLARYAADAARLQSAYKACTRAYDAARDALK